MKNKIKVVILQVTPNLAAQFQESLGLGETSQARRRPRGLTPDAVVEKNKRSEKRGVNKGGTRWKVGRCWSRHWIFDDICRIM